MVALLNEICLALRTTLPLRKLLLPRGKQATARCRSPARQLCRICPRLMKQLVMFLRVIDQVLRVSVLLKSGFGTRKKCVRPKL